MTDRFRLDGLCALITGGGGGIGAAGAEALAAAGADVALVGRDRDKLDAAAERVRAAGRRALVVSGDVVDEGSIAAAVAEVETVFGRIDILFNNAGITSPKPFLDLASEEWHRVLNVNLTGAFLTTRAAVPGMVARGSGRIINMGSILGGRGMASRSVYCASKAGLANLGAALALELGPSGITVNTLAATVIVTDLNRDLVRTQPEVYAQVLKRTALGRLGDLDDLTGALVFLASPAARFITGQTLYVDGGYTAG